MKSGYLGFRYVSTRFQSGKSFLYFYFFLTFSLAFTVVFRFFWVHCLDLARLARFFFSGGGAASRTGGSGYSRTSLT